LRTGVVYRSNAPVEIGEAERAFLGSAGIVRAVDLRQPREREAEPVRLPGIDVLAIPAYVELTLLGGAAEDGDLAGHLAMVLDRFGANFAAAAGAICQADGPAVFFCANGKDRTGIVAMLLLDACGAADEAIIADFYQTELAIPADLQSALRAQAIGVGFPPRHADALIGAAPEVMHDLLDHLRSAYCGGARYLEQFGLDRGDLQRLVDRMAT
jgi:protein-tyrosine phosphatase